MGENMITIAMTGRRPVKIDADVWEEVASVKDWDNRYECQANRIWRLAVRLNPDGRALVYGHKMSQYEREADLSGGELTEAGEDIGAAVLRVAETIGASPQLAQRCLDCMPADEL